MQAAGLGDAHPGDDARHPRPACGYPADDVGVKQHRLEKLGVLLLQQSPQSAHGTEEMPISPGTEVVDLYAGRFQGPNQQVVARRGPARQAVDDGREAAAVEPGGQLDNAPLGAADLQIRDAQCYAEFSHPIGLCSRRHRSPIAVFPCSVGSPAPDGIEGLYSFVTLP